MVFFFEIIKLGASKFPKLGLPPLWMPMTSCADHRLRRGLKKSYNHCQDLSNDKRQTPYKHVNQGDSKFLVVGGQINTLSSGPSFGHNLCCKYSNG